MDQERLVVSAFGQSDVGWVRPINEDRFGLFPALSLYIVADGMGGHAGGEIASRIAVDETKQFFEQEGHAQSQPQGLIGALQSANDLIYKVGGSHPEWAGMGTTIVAVYATSDVAHLAFVGDSRAYLYREPRLTQITRDHSLVNKYIEQGLITPEMAACHPMRHVLSRALGLHPNVEIETLSHTPEENDLLLVCSDGLSNKLSAKEIQQMLSESKNDLEASVHLLIQKAKDKGGEDNITAVLIGYHSMTEAPSTL